MIESMLSTSLFVMRVTAPTFAGIAYNNFGSSGIALEKLVEALCRPPQCDPSSQALARHWRIYMHFALCAGLLAIVFILLTPAEVFPALYESGKKRNTGIGDGTRDY
jgi:hypothetical protein